MLDWLRLGTARSFNGHPRQQQTVWKANSSSSCCFSSSMHEHNGQLAAALRAAQQRATETLRPDALFQDPHAACLASLKQQEVAHPERGHYELSTRFIDDKLLQLLNSSKANQVVLLTDGMDTRPYRLAWPSPTVIFDVSPASVFAVAAQELRALGAKLPRNCLLQHIPCDSLCSEWSGALVKSGYRGDRPSVWAVQGIDLTAAHLQCMLEAAGRHARKGTPFVGEIPRASFGEADKSRLSRKKFVSNGFEVEYVSHEDLVRDLDINISLSNSRHVIFIAKQLRLSDEQVSYASKEIELAEEMGEEGFEDW